MVFSFRLAAGEHCLLTFFQPHALQVCTFHIVLEIQALKNWNPVAVYSNPYTMPRDKLGNDLNPQALGSAYPATGACEQPFIYVRH